jgi:pyruvate formate lyase activating enzyme
METKKIQGVIFDIKRFALHDGPGIRTTVFFKGCPMRCAWCHNPESQSRQPERLSDDRTIGEEKTVEDVMQEIEKELLFYDESNGGATFSGGEPLAQPEFLSALLDQCRAKEIHTALDTTGDVSPQTFDAFIDKADLFLYDLKIMDNKKHQQYTGASNRFVLENLQTLSRKKKQTVIRFPVIPGITDTEENIKAVAAFVSSLKNVRQLCLIPYHQTAEAKYQRMRKNYCLKGVTPPTARRMEEIKRLFEKYTQNIEIKNE